MAPEALRDRAFTSKSDVWSYAIVLWEIGTLGAFPYSQIHDDELQQHIITNEKRLNRPDDISTEMYDLMQCCWSSRPENRPSFDEILRQIDPGENKNPFITSNPGYGLLTSSTDNVN